MNGGDDGHRHAAPRPARLLEGVRAAPGARDERGDDLRRRLVDRSEVETGAERASLTRDDDDADGLVRAHVVRRSHQLPEHGQREAVELVRSVELDVGDAPGDRRLHIRHCVSVRRRRRVRQAIARVVQRTSHSSAVSLTTIVLVQPLEHHRLVGGAAVELEGRHGDPRNDGDDEKRHVLRRQEHRNREHGEGREQDERVQAGPGAGREVVGEVQRHRVEAHRNGQRQSGDRVVDVRARLLERQGDDVQAPDDGRQARPHEEVGVAETERAAEEAMEHLAERGDEVAPPHAHRHGDARERHEDRAAPVDGALGVSEDLLERQHGAGDDLADRDDGEQAVSLRDVVGVPRGALSTFGDQGPCQLDARDESRQGEDRRERQVHALERGRGDPQDLCDDEGRHVRRDRPAVLGVAAIGAHPLAQHRAPHDDVPDDDDRVVEVPFLDRIEGPRDAEGENDDADHLHHREQTVEPVVRVVRTREPGVVDPGPDDAEAREGERPTAPATWATAIPCASCDAPVATATTNVRSNRSSSVLATRPLSWGSRPDIGRMRERRSSAVTEGVVVAAL